jgi:integrase/recombinase XerD
VPQRRLTQAENPNHNLYLRNDIWWAEYELQGRRQRVSLRTADVAAARQERDRLLVAASAVRQGRPIPVVHTWTSAVTAWLSWLEHAPGLSEDTRERYRVSVRVWSDILGPDPSSGRQNTPLAEVTNGTLLDFVQARRADERAASTIRNDLTALSGVLKVAVAKGWLPLNPTDAFDRKAWIGTDEDALNPPTDVELAADLPALRGWRPDMADLFLWLRETGMRLREALSVRREDVHPCGKLATLYLGTKGNKPRTIHLGRAADLLAGLPEHGRLFAGLHVDSAVVSTRYGQWRRQRQEREDRAATLAYRTVEDLRRWRIHDLRHGFAIASLLDDATCLYSLQQQLGHSSVTVTERYVRFLKGAGAMRRYGRRSELFGSMSDAAR